MLNGAVVKRQAEQVVKAAGERQVGWEIKEKGRRKKTEQLKCRNEGETDLIGTQHITEKKIVQE